MPKDSKPSSIPLICILCPGNKQYSDLSHLLTHLNSKGHLQNKHKLELRGANDRGAKTTLDRFAEWYHEHNFAGLLSDRLNPKLKRGSGRDSRSTKSAAQVKPEDDTADEHINGNFGSLRVPKPHMGIKRSISVEDLWGQAAYGTSQPNSRSRLNYENDQLRDDTLVDPALENPGLGLSSDPHDAASTTGKINGGPLVLKGERFDGMDVFDAATPRTKRKRNQRKGPQILEQMIRNSAQVKPAEISYHPTGEFRGSRNIYDPPSQECSPVGCGVCTPQIDAKRSQEPKKDPTPKKRKPGRVALQDKPINVPRSKATRSQKQSRIRSPVKRELPLPQRDYGSFDFLNFQADFGSRDANQTVNPFKLAAPSTIKFRDYSEDDNDLKALSNKIRASLLALPNDPTLFKSEELQDRSFASFRHDDFRNPRGLWENPLNPTSSYAGPRGSMESNRLTNYGMRGFGADLPLHNPLLGSPTPISKTFQSEQNGPFEQLRSIATPKGLPKIGLFKVRSTSVHPLKLYRDNTEYKPSPRNPGIDRSDPVKAEATSQTISCEPSISPGMTDRPLLNETPVAKNWRTQGPVDPTLGYDYGDHMTPRYSFRQPPSSALRSTARSLRSSAGRPKSATRPHYGSDGESDIFDVRGEPFHI